MRIISRGFGQRIMIAIVLANGISVSPIGSGAAVALNPPMFVGRHSLRCELATDPIGFFGEHDLHSVSSGSKSGGDAANTAADYSDIAGERSRRAANQCGRSGQFGGTDF
jgi:hypothetical protein